MNLDTFKMSDGLAVILAALGSAAVVWPSACSSATHSSGRMIAATPRSKQAPGGPWRKRGQYSKT